MAWQVSTTGVVESTASSVNGFDVNQRMPPTSRVISTLLLLCTREHDDDDDDCVVVDDEIRSPIIHSTILSHGSLLLLAQVLRARHHLRSHILFQEDDLVVDVVTHPSDFDVRRIRVVECFPRCDIKRRMRL